jgi:peptidoglycan/xylan/chitin deacetylase (PgdA/CDA1 family)
VSDLINKQPPARPQDMPSLFERLRHRLARHVPVAPFNATSDAPAVSFTFDDAPVSATTEGAALLEAAGGRATYYIASGLMGQRDEHWEVAGPDAIVDLHARGHEIGCHGHSHLRADWRSPDAIEADVLHNHALLKSIEPSMPLKNFAYPYGHANLGWKRRLNRHFRSSRSIWPHLNDGPVDSQFLNAIPLMNREMDEDRLDRAMEVTAQRKGWLIFYTHDVTNAHSDYGCSPSLLKHALRAAERFGVKIETVDQTLTRIGARISTLWLFSLPLI